MTSNTTRPTKTKTGGPHHCNQLKNLTEKHSALQVTFAQGLNDMDKLTRENQTLKDNVFNCASHIDKLETEARRNEDNIKDRNKCRQKRNIMIGVAMLQIVLICILGAR